MGLVMGDRLAKHKALRFLQPVCDAFDRFSGRDVNCERHLYHTSPYYHIHMANEAYSPTHNGGISARRTNESLQSLPRESVSGSSDAEPTLYPGRRMCSTLHGFEGRL